MSPAKLYYSPLIASSRGALLAARAARVPLETELIDIFSEENVRKLDPPYCVTALLDDGFILHESHAIATYLADKYGKDDEWYPKDFKRRSLIHETLFYDAKLQEKIMFNIYTPILTEGQTEHTIRENIFNISFSEIDECLSESQWIAGDTPTIADTSLYGTMNGLLALDWDFFPFPYIKRWVKDCKSHIPGVAESDENAKIFADIIKNVMRKPKSEQ